MNDNEKTLAEPKQGGSGLRSSRYVIGECLYGEGMTRLFMP